MKNFPNRLVSARKMNGFTAKEFSSIMGFTTYYLKQYEIGKKKPDHAMLIIMSHALNVNIEYFYRDQFESIGTIHWNLLK